MYTDPTRDRSSRALDWRSNPDLAAIAAYSVVAAAILALGSGLPAAVRIPIALPLLVFVPGYAAVAALFPASRVAGRDTRGRPGGDASARLAPLERLTLSVVTSVALVPVVALVANAVVGVTLVPVLVGVVAVTLAWVLVAARRRSAGADPLAVAGRDSGGDSREELLDRVSFPRNAVTLAAIAVATLLLATSAVVAFTGAPSGDPATQFYLVDDTEDGQFAGEEYERTLEVGESTAFALAIEHDADRPREYTVVSRLEHLETSGNETRVLTSTELRRDTTTVDPGDPAVVEHSVEPDVSGDDRRLAFLLYRGDAPPEPDRASAHRVLTLPIDVVPAGD